MRRASPAVPARFVLTGPTGWIGRALLAMLHKSGDDDCLGIEESVALFGSREGALSLPDGRELLIRPLNDMSSEDTRGAHVVHLAYLTKDKVNAVGEDVFRATNDAIDQAVLNAVEDGRPASIFVASSGAARQAESGIDRHPYGVAKLMQEARFLKYGALSGVPVLCGRIFNLAGPHINKLEDYAVSNFAAQALDRKPIKIQAVHPVFRSFLHVDDLCRLVLRSARTGVNRDKALDLCGAEIVEMQDIAVQIGLICKAGEGFERSPISYEKIVEYVGYAPHTLALAMELGVCLKGFSEQLKDTVDWMQAQRIRLPSE